MVSIWLRGVKGINGGGDLERWLAVGGVFYLCSWILRVMTWWTSCSMSATVASGASVTHDSGTGFHRPTWIRPVDVGYTHRGG